MLFIRRLNYILSLPRTKPAGHSFALTHFTPLFHHFVPLVPADIFLLVSGESILALTSGLDIASLVAMLTLRF